MNTRLFLLLAAACCLGGKSVSGSPPPVVVHPVKDQATHDLLRGWLRGPDPAMRVHALRALAVVADPEDAAAVRSLWADEEGGVRAEALRAAVAAGFAGRLDAEETGALQRDPSPAVRAAFFELLPRLRVEEDSAILLRGLDDPDEAVRLAAAAAAPGRVASTLLEDRIYGEEPSSVRDALYRGLLAWGGSDRAALLAWGFQADDPEATVAALEALDAEDADLAGAVAAALQAPLLIVAEEAARAAGRLAVPGLKEPLLARLAGADPGLKQALCESLGAFPRAETVAALRNELSAVQGPLAHRAAARALLATGRPDARETLAGFLNSRQPQVRAFSAEALGDWGDPSMAARLTPLLHDPEDDVVLQALIALRRLDPSAAAVEADRLRSLMDHPGYRVSAAAIRILGDLNDRASVPAMTLLLTRIRFDALHPPRVAALEALQRMGYRALVDRAVELATQMVIPPPPGIPSPSYDHDEVRQAALQYLARFGPEGTAERLLAEFTETPPLPVRVAFAEAMSQWKGRPYRALPDQRTLHYDIESLSGAARAIFPPLPGIEPVPGP